MAMLEGRPNDGREGSCSRSSDYAASTPLSIENRYPNQIHYVDQFIHKKINQNYYNDKAKTSSDQLLPQGYESITRVSHRFYKQVTYDDQLQAYVFVDTRTLVPAENSMYIIFPETTKRNIRYNLEIRQFRQSKAEDC